MPYDFTDRPEDIAAAIEAVKRESLAKLQGGKQYKGRVRFGELPPHEKDVDRRGVIVIPGVRL